MDSEGYSFQSPVEDSYPADPKLYYMASQFFYRMNHLSLENLADLRSFIVQESLIFTRIFSLKSVQHAQCFCPI